ncbi:protein phosphatase 2C domain-containing protein [Colwellia sp. D2M02]|uniref:PP2C family serine/threonine-protein phosphatase n=1 Tax=Colwellia sp. D2M02 TaxID=2841562 RepID=UPI001C08AAD9|nr:PP2C family serine/threonine-protein phosphatase [Colwellia sp. D2M02]MBU2893260.1 protein phosphatase 2C domain-containing protein [Colwellia sp. D2M02]
MSTRFLGSAITGTSHLSKDIPCQDAWQVTKNSSGVVACLSDGAGSAVHSHIGSRLLVDTVCQALAHTISTDENTLSRIEGAISQVRDEVSKQGPLSDYHATLCGIVTNNNGSLVFHIGDGLIIGINPDDWSDFVVSEPENGEFAETTYFFTLPDWQSHLRYICAPERYKLWFLMSDGAASFSALTNPYRPTENFLLPVHQYLKSVDSITGEQALANTLKDPRTDVITSDDKTLVWLFNE